jgi:transcriptional regulator with XRE-family HTH domain
MASNNRRKSRKGKGEEQARIRDSLDHTGQLLEEERANRLNADEGQDNLTTSRVTGWMQAPGSVANEPDLGATIRRLREERNLSLKEVAMRSDLTPSFLSQVERNLTSPSVASLRKVAQAFGVPLTSLFQGPTAPEDHVVRRSERRQLIHPRRQWRDYLLTPNLTGKLQVILSIIEPGGGSGEEPYAHDSDEECVVVLRGRLEFWVGSDWYLLEEGDSIVFESRIPHRNSNPGPDQAEVLWITTPPSY